MSKVSELSDLEKRYALSHFVLPAKRAGEALNISETVDTIKEMRGTMGQQLELALHEMFEDPKRKAEQENVVTAITGIPVVELECE
jgi:hypothetical protein